MQGGWHCVTSAAPADCLRDSPPACQRDRQPASQADSFMYTRQGECAGWSGGTQPARQTLDPEPWSPVQRAGCRMEDDEEGQPTRHSCSVADQQIRVDPGRGTLQLCAQGRLQDDEEDGEDGQPTTSASVLPSPVHNPNAVLRHADGSGRHTGDLETGAPARWTSLQGTA